MPTQFTFTVIETVAFEKVYIVEADTLEEAEENALNGMTVGEETIRTLGVVNREMSNDYVEGGGET